jgi:hypothetical protein
MASPLKSRGVVVLLVQGLTNSNLYVLNNQKRRKSLIHGVLVERAKLLTIGAGVALAARELLVRLLG